MSVKVKIKMTGSDAKKAAKDMTAQGIKDASGANYVSNNSLHIGASAANPQGPVKSVSREINPVEKQRQSNNHSRDARTNLGRGKSGNVTID